MDYQAQNARFRTLVRTGPPIPSAFIDVFYVCKGLTVSNVLTRWRDLFRTVQMKSVLCALLLAVTVAAHAQQAAKVAPTQAADLTTLSGRTYKQARVMRVEPDGINYMFAGGIVKIPFTDLPEAVRKLYGYDPKQAAAFSEADAEAQRAASEGVQAAYAQKRAQDRAVAIATAQDIAAIPAGPSVGSSTMLHSSGLESSGLESSGLQSGTLNDAATSRTTVNGKVLQVINEGLLISKGETVTLLQGYPHMDDVAEGAHCRAIGERKGTFEYTQADGTDAQIARYQFISGVVSNPR
jgi:hypothetical protein